MSYFRYACIGIGTLVVFVAALWGVLYGLWAVLYGVGYLITTVATYFKLDPAQLALSWFELCRCCDQLHHGRSAVGCTSIAFPSMHGCTGQDSY